MDTLPRNFDKCNFGSFWPASVLQAVRPIQLYLVKADFNPKSCGFEAEMFLLGDARDRIQDLDAKPDNSAIELSCLPRLFEDPCFYSLVTFSVDLTLSLKMSCILPPGVLQRVAISVAQNRWSTECKGDAGMISPFMRLCIFNQPGNRFNLHIQCFWKIVLGLLSCFDSFSLHSFAHTYQLCNLSKSKLTHLGEFYSSCRASEK